MQYRIRYGIYRVEASSAEEARRKVLTMFRNHLSELVHVETAEPRKSVLQMLFFG